MGLFNWVLMALGTLPPAYADRNEVGREARMETIAQAVTEVAERATCTGRYEVQKCERIWSGKPKQLAALLITKGWWESRFAGNVHEGRCGKHECDAAVVDGVVIHRARSVWQLQRTSFSEPDWDSMLGTSYEATRGAAWSAAKVLAKGRERCGGDGFGILSWYGRQRCGWDGALNRNRTYKKLMALP